MPRTDVLFDSSVRGVKDSRAPSLGHGLWTAGTAGDENHDGGHRTGCTRSNKSSNTSVAAEASLASERMSAVCSKATCVGGCSLESSSGDWWLDSESRTCTKPKAFAMRVAWLCKSLASVADDDRSVETGVGGPAEPDECESLTLDGDESLALVAADDD